MVSPLVKLRHFDRLTLGSANAAPDCIGHDDRLWSVIRAYVNGQNERHFCGMIFTDKPATETAGCVGWSITYPASCHVSPTSMHPPRHTIVLFFFRFNHKGLATVHPLPRSGVGQKRVCNLRD
jgi:hypothetical protein